MRQEPLFTITDRRAVFAAGMAPAQWVRGQQRELERLGFLLRHSAWVKSFSAMSPHLHPDQPLWGDALPALLGEWTQQTELPKEAQRKPGSKPSPASPASLAETQWRKDFSTIKGNKRHTKGTRSRPPSSSRSRIGQAPTNPQQRQRPSALSPVTSHVAPITDQASPVTGKPLPSVKPQPYRLQPRIAESVLQKITSEHMNALPAHSTLRDKPFVPFNGAQTNIHPPVADHPTLRKNWQNDIAKRALQHMKILGDSHRNTLPDPEALTGQWRLMLDGPQAPQGQLVRPTAPKTKADKHSPHHTEPATANTAKKTPASPLAMDKDSPGRIPETAEPSPTTPPAARISDNAGVTRKHGCPDAQNVEQRHQQQPLSAAPDSNRIRTPSMPAEPVLDGLIREAASGIPGIASESLISAHDPLPTNLPAPSEQTRPPDVLNKTLATQADLGDLAEQIKQILDEEARRHGIDV